MKRLAIFNDQQRIKLKKWRGAKYKTSLRDNTKNEKEEDDMDFA